MGNDDTIKLLQECDAGTKMAVASIDEVIDKAHDKHVKELLKMSKQHHEELGNDLHALLAELGSDEKEPNPMAKGMSWMKTNMKMGIDCSDATIADLMTDGCNMGAKSLHRYLNQYVNADQKSKDICNRLIEIECQLTQDMAKYL